MNRIYRNFLLKMLRCFLKLNKLPPYKSNKLYDEKTTLFSIVNAIG